MINNLKPIVNLNGFLVNCYLVVYKKINMKNIINILSPLLHEEKINYVLKNS